MKKILFFTRPLAPPWDEASKNLAHDIALHSQKEDFDYQLLTTPSYASKLKRRFSRISPLAIYSYPQFSATEKIRLLRWFFTKPLKANLIHFLFTPRNLTSDLIKRRLRKFAGPTVQTIATLSPTYFSNPRLLKKVLFAKLIVTQSHHTQKKIQQAGIENTETIYPGIDLEKFSPAPVNKKLAQKLGIDPGKDLVLLYAGEYTRLGGDLEDVIEAFKLIKQEEAKDQFSKKTKLIVACRIKSAADRTKEKELREMIEKSSQRSYTKDIILPGHCTNMPGIYNLSGIHLFPARKMEGKFDIPYVVIEAMACGKPVIVSDLSILQEFVTDKENGLITPQGKPERLAEKITTLVKNESLREKLGQNAYQYAQENFNIKKTAKKYEEVYQKLLSK